MPYRSLRDCVNPKTATIYVHWPFCLSKCHYCDFNSSPYRENLDFSEWFEAYVRILRKFKQDFCENYAKEITSVYFGGGTPSLLPVWFVSNFLEIIEKEFKVSKDIEITLEANPKTMDKVKALGLRRAGVNRLSIGVQSIIDSDLKMLGRIHNAKEAKESVFEASEFFDNLSIDLIYNRPGQKISDWERELSEVLDEFPISHVSLYELIVEDGTRLKSLIDSEIFPRPSDSSIFFEKTIEIAKSKNFEMYEISNFAKNKRYGKHNLSYWNYEDYYGIGPGAHSRCSVARQKFAIEQMRNTRDWLNWAQDNPVFEKDLLSEDDVFKEKLIMGLRSKLSGFSLENFSQKIYLRYGLEKKIENLAKNLYIMYDGRRVLLTYSGMMRLNLIIRYLTMEK